MDIIGELIGFLCALGIHDYDADGVCKRCKEKKEEQ